MSNFLKLNMEDVLKGFIVAILGAFLQGVLVILQSGALPQVTDLRSIGMIAITAGVAYLIKNVFTNSNGQILKKEGT